jgi:hypothetical protein
MKGQRWGPPHKAEGLVWGRPPASTEPATAGDPSTAALEDSDDPLHLKGHGPASAQQRTPVCRSR